MNRIRDFFIREATESLGIMRWALDGPHPDVAALHGAVRRLRGSAQLARFGAIAERAGRFEDELKPMARAGTASPEAVRVAAMEEVDALERALAAVRAGTMEQDSKSERPMEANRVGEAEEVGIDALEYAGRSALERARELRTALEDAVVTDTPVGPILDELFDLIDLGMK